MDVGPQTTDHRPLVTAGAFRPSSVARRLWSSAQCPLLIAALLLLAACARGDDTWPQIESSGVLRVGVDPTFPPFAAAEGPEAWGLDIDLARALAAKLGLEARFTYFGYDGLYDALATKQVDALASALVIMPERTQDVAYTDGYYDAGQVLIVPQGAPVAGMSDVGNGRLAVELGALGHVEAQAWQRRLPALSVATYSSVDEALAAVATGAADAALIDSVSGRLYLRDHPDAALTRVAAPMTSEPYAIAVRIGDRTLHRQLNEALRALAESGELDAIVSRWLGP